MYSRVTSLHSNFLRDESTKNVSTLNSTTLDISACQFKGSISIEQPGTKVWKVNEKQNKITKKNPKSYTSTYILTRFNVLTLQSSAASYARAVDIFPSTVLPRLQRPCRHGACSVEHAEEDESFEHHSAMINIAMDCR